MKSTTTTTTTRFVLVTTAVVTTATALLWLLSITRLHQEGGGLFWDQLQQLQNHQQHHSKKDHVIVASDPHTTSSTTTSHSSSSTPNSLSLTKFTATDAPNVLNIHIVPHTHDDVGWRKTVTQYYTGANHSIDTRGHVREILSTTMAALLQHTARTFVYVETKFLALWWQEQQQQQQSQQQQQQYNNANRINDLRYLVANQQWSFVNGGWCMHDEAAAHYIGMLDQTTLGHEFLQRQLGVVPTTGWQLDPFGHSATQASLLSLSFDAMYFGRIDYQDLQLRQLTRQCEGLWNAAASTTTTTTARATNSHNNNNASFFHPIFWGLTGGYRGNYGAPPGFCFDVLCTEDEPLIGANETRLLQRLETFLQDIRVQADQTVDNHVLVTMGTDFNYMEAHQNFANLDLLISSIMDYQRYGQLDVASIMGPKYDRVQIFYSSPDYYTRQKHASWKQQQQHARTQEQRPPAQSMTDTTTTMWQTKTDDFFPYSDCEHCFWTGYFTSRTAFKRMERVASSFLLAARQIDVLATTSTSRTSASATRSCNGSCSDGDCADSRGEHVASTVYGCDCCGCCKPPLFALEDALGVAQHHDAISGTGKQHVADDYSFQLHHGLQSAAKHVGRQLQILLQSHENDVNNSALEWTYCPLLHNESICDLSVSATRSHDATVYLAVYNALPRNRSTIVRLPVASVGDAYQVYDFTSNQTQVVYSIGAPLIKLDDAPRFVLLWNSGTLPPLGLKTFSITKIPSNENDEFDVASDDPPVEMKRDLLNDNPTVQLTNGLVTVDVDASTGQIKKMASNGIELGFQQSWGYYTSFDSRFDRSEVQPASTQEQNSGAYIFRPSTPTQELTLLKPRRGAATFVNTSVGTEIHVTFMEPWIRQVTRVLMGQPYVEIEYTIGPIPINDGRGKEIVTRYATPAIKSNATFFTDSNGREFQRRHRNYRPSWNLDVYEPIAGNYYPVNAAIFLQDSKASMAVVVDRSQGGSSLQDGTLELMVQRRTLADDARGVDEPLNETCGGMTPYPPYGMAERTGEGVVVRGIHRLMVGAGQTGASLARSSMDAAFSEPVVFVGASKTSVDMARTAFSGLQVALPPNVFIVTLAKLTDCNQTTFLLRLGHQYAQGDDEALSAPVSVDLEHLFVDFRVDSVEELSLTGNERWGDFVSRRLEWTGGELRSSLAPNGTFVVELLPMEIRTYEIVCSGTPNR